MRNEERFCVWSDLVDDAIVFSKHKLKFVVVVLKLLFLKQDNLSLLRDVNSNAGQALGLSD